MSELLSFFFSHLKWAKTRRCFTFISAESRGAYSVSGGIMYDPRRTRKLSRSRSFAHAPPRCSVVCVKLQWPHWQYEGDWPSPFEISWLNSSVVTCPERAATVTSAVSATVSRFPRRLVHTGAGRNAENRVPEKWLAAAEVELRGSSNTSEHPAFVLEKL